MKTDNELPERIDTNLSDYQIGKAAVWYGKNKAHVDKLVQQDIPAYPPTNRYDKLDPAVWKANHWKWYLNTFKLS
jgi:hypothetical protein